jgi:uncharacterized protein YgfB (UPF0149 family)
MTSMTYGDLDQSLRSVGSGVEAAEAHGCLCGALCVERNFPAAEWAAEVLPDGTDEAVARPVVELLSQFRDETLVQLGGGDMEFQPLLPLDEEPLEARVRALAAWCAGFLYGLGRSGTLDSLPGDLDEILRDFSEISRATLSPEESGDEAENDYMELVEFVRASVQLSFEELASIRARSLPAGAHNH